jgi:hypothetical protein
MNEVTQVELQTSGGSLSTNKRNYFENLALAWGKALDDQADRLTARADALVDGVDSPQEVTMMTAESLRLQFLSTASHTGLTSVGTALETLARKQ